MDLVVGRRGKLEAAALAGVGLLLAVVHPPVRHQLALLGKALVAVAAAERLLACGGEDASVKRTSEGWTETPDL